MKEQRTDVRQEDSKDGNEGRREGCVGRNKDTMEGRKEGRKEEITCSFFAKRAPFFGVMNVLFSPYDTSAPPASSSQ